jgi:hypothetical protein
VCGSSARRQNPCAGFTEPAQIGSSKIPQPFFPHFFPKKAQPGSPKFSDRISFDNDNFLTQSFAPQSYFPRAGFPDSEGMILAIHALISHLKASAPGPGAVGGNES